MIAATATQRIFGSFFPRNSRNGSKNIIPAKINHEKTHPVETTQVGNPPFPASTPGGGTANALHHQNGHHHRNGISRIHPRRRTPAVKTSFFEARKLTVLAGVSIHGLWLSPWLFLIWEVRIVTLTTSRKLTAVSRKQMMLGKTRHPNFGSCRLTFQRGGAVVKPHTKKNYN